MTDSVAKITHATKVDTLQAEVHKLHSTIDSLHREIHDFGIASTYYHDIINMNVATFVGIITIIVAVIGFLSWRIVRQSALEVKKELSNKLIIQQQKFDEFTKRIDSQIKEFEKKHDRQSQLTNRLNYYAANSAKEYEWALYWALQSAIGDIKLNKGKAVDTWMEFAIDIANKDLKKEDLRLNSEGSYKDITRVIDELTKLNHEVVNNYINDLKTKVNSIMYSEDIKY